MTRLDIRTSVRYRLRETTASVWSDAELNIEINLAQRYVASQLDGRYLPQLIQEDTASVTSSTLNYDLDANFMRIVGNPDVNGTEYPIVSPEEGKRTKNYGTNHIFSGKDVSYISNNDLYFSDLTGMSGQTATWLFLKWPSDLSTDGTSSEIQDSVIDLVIDRAAGQALIKTQPDEGFALIQSVNNRIKELSA